MSRDDLDPARGLIYAVLLSALFVLFVVAAFEYPAGVGIGLVFCGGYALGRLTRSVNSAPEDR